MRALEDVGQQLLDVGADAAGAAGEGDVAAEQGAEADRRLLVLRHADAADDAAGADDAERLLVGRPVADALEHGVGAVAAGQLADLLDALLAALGDDVGGAELEAQVGAGLVPAHEDDLLGAQPLGGEHRHSPTAPSPITVTVVRAFDARRDGGVVTGDETSDSVSSEGSSAESSPTGALTRVPSACGTRTASAWPRREEAAVPAGGVQTLAAELARVVGVGERGDDEVARLEGGDVGTDFLDDADELVAHGRSLG